MCKKRNDYRDDEEPLTPVGRYFVRSELNHVILCGIGFANPIDIDAIIEAMAKFVLDNVPRFSTLLVYDPFDGSHSWKQTRVKFNDHVFIHYDDETILSYDDIINSYMTNDIMMSPLSLDKPLWELHIVPKHKFMILKVHHALGDGMSLMSMLWSMGRPKKLLLLNDNNNNHNYGVGDVNNKRVMPKKSIFNIIWEFIENIWYGFIFTLNFIARILWEKDEIVKRINGSRVVDVVKPNMATATFSLHDMKVIKRAIPNATIHDVLYGTVWCGLTKYLSIRCPQAMVKGDQITGLCPTNLRKQKGLQDISKMNCESSWGNKFGLMLTPIFYYPGLDPLMYVKKAKFFMDRKKQLMEAPIAHRISCIISTILGSNKISSLMISKLASNSTFLLSNIVGPPEEITIGGNPVTLIRMTLFSPQPQEITMHMVSYKGRADLQIQVGKSHVFSDPKFLARCFQDSLASMTSASNKVTHMP